MNYKPTAQTRFWLHINRRARIDNYFITAGAILLAIAVAVAVARLCGWPGLTLNW